MSADMRALFAAAREDGPADSAREAMWGRVAASTIATSAGGLAAAGAAPAVKASVLPAATKLVAVGGLIGAVSTALGVVVAVVVVSPGEASVAPAARTEARAARSVGQGAKLRSTTVRRREAVPPPAPSSAASPPAGAARAPEAALASAEETASDLAQEAKLVADARRALVAGDPTSALAIVQETRKLRARALEPEELGLEARALRAEGRTDDAEATELVLRRRYPDHALAR